METNETKEEQNKEEQPQKDYLAKEIIMETSETKEEQNKKEQPKKDYLAYEGDFKKINYLKIGVEIIEIILILLLTFLPIFVSKDVVATLDFDDFDSLSDYYQYLSSLSSKSFSIFEELIRNIGCMMKANGDSETTLFAFTFIIFPAVSVIMTVISLVLVGKELYSLVVANNDTKQLAMIEYNEIKKTGSIDKKKGNIFKKQAVYLQIMYVIFTIIFGVIFSKMYATNFSETVIGQATYLSSLKGVSAQIIFPIIFLVGYVVISHFEKQMENKVLTDITTKEYNG